MTFTKRISLNTSNINIGLILVAAIINKLFIFSIASTVSNDMEQFNARGVRHALLNCLSNREMSNCFKEQLLSLLEAAAKDNSTWHYNDFLSIEKNSSNINQNSTFFLHKRQERSFADTLAEKLFHVAQTRSLRLTLPNALSSFVGISDGIDEVLTTGTSSTPTLLTSFIEEGTIRDISGLVDGKIEAIEAIASIFNSGRKKKDKDKHIAMMGGMAMMAMVAQMFFGKVMLIAGAAFIMAKIALTISILGSLKKGASGHSGSTTEHVIISRGGHGGGSGGGHSSHGSGHDSSWHRSMLPYDYLKHEPHNPEQTSLSEQSTIDDEYRWTAGSPSRSTTINNGKFSANYDAKEMKVFL